MSEHLRAFSGLRQEGGMVLELGVLHIYFQKQVARIVKSLQDLPEPSPVNRSLKRQHGGIRAAVVVDGKGQ